MKRRLDDFLAGLTATQSIHDTWTATASFLKSEGFDLMMYGYAATDDAGALAEVETLSNFPAVYQQRYREKQYYRHDPVVHHCVAALTPRLVGRGFLHHWPERGQTLTPAQHNIINEAADCGMAVGVVIPLRSPGRYPLAGISLSNTMRPKEFERFFAAHGDRAQLAVIHAHTRLQMQLESVGNAGSGIVLSSQEHECLRWVARGMSSKGTAQQMGLSPKTVDFHIAKIMGKLGSSTRSQALADAIALGLLRV